MSEKNPLPFAKTQSRAMLLWVLAVLIGLPLILPSATLATEILIFAMAAPSRATNRPRCKWIISSAAQ